MKNQSQIAIRLRILLERLQMSPYRLSKRLGYKKTDSVYAILGDRASLGPAFQVRLKAMNKRINIDWILTGEGEPLISSCRARVGDYGMELFKEEKIIYPAKLSMTSLLKISSRLARFISYDRKLKNYCIDVRRSIGDGVEFRFTKSYVHGKKQYAEKEYHVVVGPDWQVSAFFDWWRVDEPTRRCQNLLKLLPKKSTEMNDVILDTLTPIIKSRKAVSFTRPYLGTDDWQQIFPW